MKRKCDRCDNEATVHETTIKDAQQVERHLCENCAREEGIVIQSHAPINELITKFVLSKVGGGTPEKRAGACPECGMTFADFRQQGLLGCPACYDAFDTQLAPLIERAHEGGSHHSGKTPRRAGTGAGERQQRLMSLRKQLSDAIAAEEYEKAANLRDQLASIDRPAPTLKAQRRVSGASGGNGGGSAPGGSGGASGPREEKA